jgi:hypothetical protein
MLFKTKLFERFDELLWILDIEESAKFFGHIDLLEEKFTISSKSFMGRSRELPKSVLKSIKVRCVVLIKLHKP